MGFDLDFVRIPGRFWVSMLVLSAWTVLYGVCLYTFNKFEPGASWWGIPVWFITFIAVVGVLFLGSQLGVISRPYQRDRKAGIRWYVFFAGFAALAVALGVYFTEPIICEKYDGDLCYAYTTPDEAFSRTQAGLESPNAVGVVYYRNSWVYREGNRTQRDASSINWVFHMFSDGSSSDSDSDSSLGFEWWLVLGFIIVVIVITCCCAFVPQLWILAFGLAMSGFMLTFLRDMILFRMNPDYFQSCDDVF